MKQVRYYFGNIYLTVKEAQVVSLLRQGFNTKQVAFMFDNSDETIETIIKNVGRKINTNTRSQLVIYAMEHGFDKGGCLAGVNLFEGCLLNPLPPGAAPRA